MILAGALSRKNIEKQTGQQKARKVVEGQGHLDALPCLLVDHKPCPGIVDQNVKAIVPPLEFGCKLPNLRLVRQISHQEING